MYNCIFKQGATMRKKIIGIFVFIAGIAGVVYSAPVSGFANQEQLEVARMRELSRQERLHTPRVENRIEGIKENTESNNASEIAFRIDEIVLLGTTEEFDWLSDIIKSHIHTDMGVLSIQKLVSKLNTKLLDKGYVTSRVVIPEQNIKNGKLLLQLHTGKLHNVIYSKESAVIPWRNAFPIKEGDVLNLRRLEQGLEQIKRVNSLDVSMKLIPAEEIGMTDLELTVMKDKQLWGSLSVDDSGLENTGRIQWNTTMGIDRIFNANDIFRYSVNMDGSRDGYKKGTRGQTIYYSVPYGKDTMTLQYSDYRYHQTINLEPYPFISAGKTCLTKFTFDHVINRTKTKKRNLDISIIKRDSHTYINDTEILVQAMNTTALEIGIAERMYIGDSTLYTHLGYKIGTGWFGAQRDTGNPDEPKTHYKMWLLDIDYRKPFTMAYRPAAFTSSFHGQWTTKGIRLHGVDMISIGNRYTVRGFDGKYTLMAESGWYLRNELESFISQIHGSAYLGLDVGAVYGVSADILVGKTVAGAGFGLRGIFPSGFSYDVFMSRALYKPKGYHTGTWVSGFILAYKF